MASGIVQAPIARRRAGACASLIVAPQTTARAFAVP
jgi:hypothetical protein